MSMHINRFVDSIKAHEARQQRDFVMSMRDAKDLHADITKLLLIVQQLQARALDQQQDSVVSVEVQGGSF
jgi:hypothetical protein